MDIPVLKTSRLVLRGFRLEDFDDYAAVWADPDVTRHIGDGSTKAKEESWTSFLRHVGQWHMLGFGGWLVEEKTTGKQIGTIGFTDRRRDRGTEFDHLPELGWMFMRAASGQGYATESLRAVLEWGRTRFGPVRVVAIVAPENEASKRVALKCGFVESLRAQSVGHLRLFFTRVL
jgi:RimJ/RimL family protein N-acetyltransferase